MNAENRRAFSLLELLVILAILALIMGILAPAFVHTREQARRTACASNLRSLGVGLHLYSTMAPGEFPAIGPKVDNGAMYLFDPSTRTSAPSTTGIPSPTVDLWTIVSRSYCIPKQFLCPSTRDEPDPAQDSGAYYDFLAPANLSYGYQYQHSPHSRILGFNSLPDLPLMADANPYVKGGAPPADFAADRVSPFRGNSANHPDRQGQNVLYVAGDVAFEFGPDIGMSGSPNPGLQISRGRDHCYAVHGTQQGAPVDYGSAAPTWNGPTSIGYCDLGSKSDTCLVP
jgi:type II secretory pathway pseudopilin PulG